MHFKKILLIVLAVVTVVFAMILPSFADLGGYSGDSDFGGSSSSSDWGGSSSWSSSDYGGSHSGSGDSDPVAVLILIIIIVVVVVVKSKAASSTSKTAGNRRSVAPGAKPTDMSTLRRMSEYRNIDPNFSEEEMKEKLANLYVQMQNCCTAKNISSLRPYLTDTLYAQYDRQMDTLKKQGRTNYVDRIAVMEVNLVGFKQSSADDVIVARLKTRIVDYTVDDNTGKLISGSNTREKFMDYEWTLSRKRGAVSGNEEKTINCPNCGAPVNINKTAECEYCGSILTVDNYDWVLTSVKAISQRTV